MSDMRLSCRDVTNPDLTFQELLNIRVRLVTSRQAKAYRTLFIGHAKNVDRKICITLLFAPRFVTDNTVFITIAFFGNCSAIN